MGIFKRIFEGGEENIISEYSKIISLAMEANTLVKKTINKDGDVSSIKQVERDSDAQAFRLSGLIVGGGIVPNLIDNMLALVISEDSIVDSISNLSKELHRYKTKKNIDEKLKKGLYDISILADSALETLARMHKSDKLSEIKRLRQKVKLYEQQGDDIKDGLLDFAYTAKCDFKTFHHIVEAAHLGDDILDSCEDSSDLYLTIMSSIIT